MKKPGKPKPKRRSRHANLQAPGTVRAGTAVQRVMPASTVAASVRLASPRGSAAAGFAGDDRQLMALMFVPFLLVAVFVGFNQQRRVEIGRGIEQAERRPVAPVAIELPSRPAMSPQPAPTSAVPDSSGQAVAPSSPPSQIAMAPVQPPVVSMPAPVPVTPAAPVEAVHIDIPGVLSYPPPLPTIDIPPPPPFVPPHAIVYPPAPPFIDVAALDARPAMVPAPTPALAPVPLPSSIPPSPLAVPLPAAPDVAMVPVPVLPAQALRQCAASSAQLTSFSSIGRFVRGERKPRLVGVDAETFGLRLAQAAVEQTRDLVIYSARYQPMAYPMGDVVGFYGACIDVVIRAYRALGIDLQEEVQRARGTRGDPNIDHRRTENMRRFFQKHATSLPITAFPEDYKPGDIVTYHRPFSRVSTSHIAIVTDVLAPTGRPMIVHNRGYGAQIEDALFVDRITGHYRYMGGPLSAPSTGPVSKPAVGSAAERAVPVQPRPVTRVGSSRGPATLTP